MVVAFGIQERALAEYQRLRERRRGQAQLSADAELGRRAQHTEDLVRQVLGLEVEANSGQVSVEGLTIGARFVELCGYTTWRLCLLEPCRFCGHEVAAPFVSFAGLGEVIANRTVNGQPKCERWSACEERQRANNRAEMEARDAALRRVPTS